MIIVNTLISLAYIEHSGESILELQQNNLSNTEASSELCQTSERKCVAKIVNG